MKSIRSIELHQFIVEKEQIRTAWMNKSDKEMKNMKTDDKKYCFLLETLRYRIITFIHYF